LPQLSLSDLASTAHSIEQVKLIPSRRHSSLPGLMFCFFVAGNNSTSSRNATHHRHAEDIARP
jgi:hypothetical protein